MMNRLILATALALAAAPVQAQTPQPAVPETIRVVEMTTAEAELLVKLLNMAVMARGFEVDREARTLAEKVATAPARVRQPPAPKAADPAPVESK